MYLITLVSISLIFNVLLCIKVYKLIAKVQFHNTNIISIVNHLNDLTAVITNAMKEEEEIQNAHYLSKYNNIIGQA
jgi:hypothetical protein